MSYQPRFPLLLLLLLVLASLQTLHAQQIPKPADDVIRVNTELVQTAITVVDKDGRFVDGLTRDQFQVLVDGKPRAISLFDRITSGSLGEGRLLPESNAPATTTSKVSTVRGRTIVFFIDDLHLAPESLDRTKQMLRKFLDHEMSTSDTVAIVSASGQIGFLQQFGSNKQVLEAAMDRLNPRAYDVRGFGTGSTKMSEYAALSIETTKSDNKVQAYYISECLKQNMPPKRSPAYAVLIAALKRTCETQVKSSARAVLMQASNITRNTYFSLESLMRSSARLPGRKLAFFISDGFLMDAGPYGAGVRDQLDRVIDAANRAGVVVYTIDARGLNTNDRVDAGNTKPRVGSGDPGIELALIGEVSATQDALHALAGDTGGRALRNTNYFDRWVAKVLDETSNYYMLAWRPETDDEKTPKFRHMQISIIGRPELTARAPKGYVTGPQPAETAKASSSKSSAASPEEAQIRDALADSYPNSSLPTLLSLTYLNTPKNETVLTSSIQVAGTGLTYGNDGKQPATLRLAGVVLNDKGKISSSFKNQLNVKPLSGVAGAGAILYNEHTPLQPGIYQVRVAARDEKSGRVGSAMEWIVIPDLATRQLTLSSLLLGGRVLEDASNKDGSAQVQLSVDHRFARASKLGYWVFVYNAKRNSAGVPTLTVKSEIRRDGQVVVASPPRTIKDGAFDPERIPFGEELPLKNLSSGRYELIVTITDGIAGAAVTQTVSFEIV